MKIKNHINKIKIEKLAKFTNKILSTAVWVFTNPLVIFTRQSLCGHSEQARNPDRMNSLQRNAF